MRMSDWSSDVCSSDRGVAAGAALLFAGFGAVAGIRPCLVMGGGMARPADAALQSSAIQHCRLHFREAALGETLGRASCGYFERTKNGQRQQGAIFRPDRKSTRLNSSH